MKGSFNIKRLADIVRNMSIGSNGIILVNPLAIAEGGISFLTENYFIFSTGLILFKSIEQANDYKKYTDSNGLFAIGIKRTGKSLDENGFELDLTVDENYRNTGFLFDIIDEDDLKLYKSNGKFIVIKNPTIVNKPFTIEEYINDLKISLKYQSAEDFDEKQYDYDMILKNNEKIKVLGDNSLKYALEKATENEEYELAKKINKEIKRRIKK